MSVGMNNTDLKAPHRYVVLNDSFRGIEALLKYLSSDLAPHTKNEINRALNESLRSRIRVEEYADDSHVMRGLNSPLSSSFERKVKNVYRHGDGDFIDTLLEVCWRNRLVSAVKEEQNIAEIGTGGGYSESGRDKGNVTYKITQLGLRYLFAFQKEVSE